MRHTFISMFVAKFRSIGDAAIQAGNSEAIIRRHYLDMKSQTDAEDFLESCRRSQPEKRNPSPCPPPPDHLGAIGQGRVTLGNATRTVSYRSTRPAATRRVYTDTRVWKRNYPYICCGSLR